MHNCGTLRVGFIVKIEVIKRTYSKLTKKRCKIYIFKNISKFVCLQEQICDLRERKRAFSKKKQRSVSDIKKSLTFCVLML